MAYIKKIDLCEITAEDLRNKEARSINTREHNETTPADLFTLDTVAPLAIAQLLREKGNEYQRTHAEKIAREWVESSAPIGGALWFCGDSETAAACTFADGFRVRCVGWVRGLVLPVLFTENKEEKERAHLVRFEW